MRAAFPGLARGIDAAAARRGPTPTAHHGRVRPRPWLDPRSEPGALVSATALETLGTCPLRYLFRYGLRVRPPDDPTYEPDRWLDPRERGTLLHRVFERALREARSADSATASAAAARLDRALRDIDRGFIGTIHAFCARLLRERPVEAGLDPGFREVSGPEETRLRREAWHRFLERLTLAGDPILEELGRVGIRPAALERLFELVSANPDVAFPADPADCPDPTPVRARLEALLDRAEPRMPREEPPGGWDPLQQAIRRLRHHRRALGWNEPARFFEDLAALAEHEVKVTPSRWGADRESKEAAKALAAEFEAFARDPATRDALDRWYAHRYPIALAFARRAAEAYEQERIRTGRLTFQDLLLRAARLLRESPAARRALARRYPRLLVDEFQDTDPVQAEVLFLLAAREPAEQDWRRAEPRPGALFVVGDPKQSIYRFRRADIAIYHQVKARFAAWGGVLELVANFRSRPPIADFVNDVFRARLPPEATERQAAFAPLVALRPDGPEQGVCGYEVETGGGRSQAAVAAADAEAVAAWIEERVRAGTRRPGDFLVLAWRKEHLARYARALEARNIPVQVTGAGVGVEEELEELLLLLEALADPDDPTRTVAVLGGLFFGLDHDALLAHREAGGSFRFLDAPGPDGPHGPVADALATLRRWWARARMEPAEIALGAIVEEIGLLPYAAAGPLGETRAGALLYALDAVRRAGLQGDTSLHAALEALRGALEAEEAETPLEPGRGDVVRVMNLHKAKGLEAPVVVLACPTGRGEHEPELHVSRPAAGAPALSPALQAIVDGAVVDLAAAVKAAESEVVELALAVAERIVERELRTDPSAVRAVVRAALEEIAALPIAQVRVHPDDLALLDTARATVIPPGLDPQIPVVADPHVERGGCIVDTTSGLVDAQPKTRLVEIRQRALALLNGELV